MMGDKTCRQAARQKDISHLRSLSGRTYSRGIMEKILIQGGGHKFKVAHDQGCGDIYEKQTWISGDETGQGGVGWGGARGCTSKQVC